MSLKVSRLVNRRLRNNALKTRPSTRAGAMVTGWGYQGKTETVCEVAAAFEDAWLALHDHLNPNTVDGVRDLRAPVAYVQTPVTAKPKGTCQAILNFFGAENRRLTLPQLIRQVADSLDDHGTQALILDDITRLRMHRADDQDTLDLIRVLMSMNVTLVLVGVDILGSGLLRQGHWDATTRQWVMPPSPHTRVHGLEATQTERRFDLVELDRFRYTTPDQIAAFHDHLAGLEDSLRLLKAEPGMLTSGTMPEYLMRRTDGVVGLLERLVEDGCQEAMDSGKETARGGILTSRRPYTGGQYLLDLGEHLNTFAHAMRLTTEEASRLTFAPDADRYPPITASIHARTRRNYLYDAWVFTKFTRYCPHCLAGNGSAIQQRHGGPWKIRWLLPISFLCLEHGKFLQDTCPGCQRPVHSSERAGSRFLPMPAHSGLHPAQCRNQRPEITSDRLLCGTRIDVEENPPQPGVTTPLRRLQSQINDLLSPCADPTQASRYFSDLRVMATVLQATWPLGKDLTPADLPDALDLHVDQLRQRQGTRGDHVERVRWDAPPPRPSPAPPCLREPTPSSP
ncbi:TniQ family protein [Streptomyces chiangmaiensis]